MAYRPSYMDALTYPAQDLRLQMADFTSTGVVGSTDLLVTQSPTPGMSVQVSPGVCYVPWTAQTGKGIYRVSSDSTVTLSIATSNATYGRYDAVVMRVYDDGTPSGSKAQLEVVTGTPAPTPNYPTLPANCLLLAYVFVAAGVTSITNSAITDMRVIAGPKKSGGFTISDLASYSVGTGQIQDGAVTSRKMKPNFYRAIGAPSGTITSTTPVIIPSTSLTVSCDVPSVLLIMATASLRNTSGVVYDNYIAVYVDNSGIPPLGHFTFSSSMNPMSVTSMHPVSAGTHTVDLRAWSAGGTIAWADSPVLNVMVFSQ